MYRETNMASLCQRNTELVRRLATIPIGSVATAPTPDGGICVARCDHNGQWHAVTNPANPIARAQEAVQQMQHRLETGSGPAVIVGLGVGYELQIVFRHFKSRLAFGEPFRRIYVVIDSLDALDAWLQSADRHEIIQCDAVEFVWHEEIHEIAERCRKDHRRSHLFVPISTLPPARMNQLIAPLTELYLERQAEQSQWHAECTAYYDQLGDAQLLALIQGEGERPPRILVPAHGHSTVVQFCARDTCEAFRNLGWEAEVLRFEEADTQWHISRTIAQFRPDLLLFINHLRTEDLDVYPANMLYITWVQDTIPLLNNRCTAESWNNVALATPPNQKHPRRRDLLVGYTSQLQRYGYHPSRCHMLPMLVNPSLFQRERRAQSATDPFACDICFASNCSEPTEQTVDQRLIPSLAPYGFNADTIHAIHDELWAFYRAGNSCTSYHELRHRLFVIPEFEYGYDALDADQRQQVLELLFWRLNNSIYRHSVLEWCVECGVDLHLYGKGWDQHPKFADFAKGEIRHGAELCRAYQGAGHALHLNASEGVHQRVLEIMQSGATPLIRQRRHTTAGTPPWPLIHQLMSQNPSAPTAADRRQMTDWLFRVARNCVEMETVPEGHDALECQVRRGVMDDITGNPAWVLENWRNHMFDDKASLEACLLAG